MLAPDAPANWPAEMALRFETTLLADVSALALSDIGADWSIWLALVLEASEASSFDSS